MSLEFADLILEIPRFFLDKRSGGDAIDSYSGWSQDHSIISHKLNKTRFGNVVGYRLFKPDKVTDYRTYYYD